MDSTFENLKNPKIREEIKKRIQAELKLTDLPFHRKCECESIMYQIKCFEEFNLKN